MSYKYTRGSEYESRNQGQIDDLTKQYTDRQFSYDASTDAAYQDYANMMRANGQKAMEDTVAKASAMTGGYGNSYATTAGQQVYNDYMSQASTAANDFYDRALARFNTEGDQLLSKLNVLQNQENSDKAAWEEAYAEDLAKAQMTGDTKALKAIYGMTPEEWTNFEESNRTPLTEEHINNYIEALKRGNGEAYMEYLNGAGYNTDNLYVEAQARGYTGAAGGDIGVVEDGDTIVGNTYTETYPYVDSGAVTNAVGGLDNFEEGEWFHISRVKDAGAHNDEEYGAEGHNYNLKLGTEHTDDKISEALSGANGVVYYDGEVYYVKGGSAFEINPRGDTEDYNNLLRYMKSIS